MERAAPALSDEPPGDQPPSNEPPGFEALQALPLRADAPRMTAAQATLLRWITVRDEAGNERARAIPVERPLTVYVDKHELVTLMTLGARPELLVLGWLLNQRLIDGAGDVEAITVDWEVGAAAVRLRGAAPDWAARTAHRVVTTGCGQGTVYGELLDALDGLALPDASQARVATAALHALLEAVRQRPSVHRVAGSVHGCALFHGADPWVVCEDVGRHNAVDTLAGWMALHDVAGGDKILYTTGRLTSEMVMKAAQMGVPIVVSRNGVTAMGHEMAQRLGMALFGRAVNRHFLCLCGFERFDATASGASDAIAKGQRVG